MGKSKSKRKKSRRSSGGSSKKKSSGVMLGMRSGFKNVANTVTGKAEAKKRSRVGTLLTVLLVVAAIAVLYRRFF